MATQSSPRADRELLRELRQSDARQPKYAQLRAALARVIDAGGWASGSTLPTELELVRLTGLSLGTVQRAVRALVDEGHVIRVKGRGTFVADRRQGLAQPFLHLRFVADDGEGVVPVFPRVLSRSRPRDDGRWSGFLRAPSADVVCVERAFDIGGEFRCYSRFYIDARRYDAFARLSPARLSSTNYKLLLAREYNLPPIAYEQTVVLGPLPGAACRAIGVRAGTFGATLHVQARAGRSMPLYYHEIFVPPSRRELHLPEVVLPTGR